MTPLGALVLAAAVAGAAAVAAAALYVGVVAGAVTIDTGWGRRLRPLGPLTVHIAADRDTVYQILTAPYLGRTTRAMQEKIHVLDRGTDLVLAAHRTHIRGRLTAVTVETVRLTPPERIDFRLLRGPVPHVVEQFTLTGDGPTTRVEYGGELGTDGWAPGAWWGRIVANRWQTAVATTLNTVKTEAERRAGQGTPK